MNIEQLKVIREALYAAKQRVSDCQYHESYEQKLECLKPIETTLETVKNEINKKHL